MDNKMKYEILAEVRHAVRMSLESAEERWISAEQLTEQFACFTIGWLKQYGEHLPRTKVDGSNRWCYPVHKINRMLAEGMLTNLNINQSI